MPLKKERESLEHGRFMMFSGKPIYSGTYHYTDINLNSNGKRITLPDHVSMTIREIENDPIDIGQLTYIENYSDDELGVNEPDQFSAEINYLVTQFEKAWTLVRDTDIGILKITVAVKAPSTDISGHEANFDVNEADAWAVNALYIDRIKKRT